MLETVNGLFFVTLKDTSFLSMSFIFPELRLSGVSSVDIHTFIKAVN